MILNRKSLAEGRLYSEEEDLVFDKSLFENRSDLKSINKCHVKISYQDFGDVLHIDVNIDANLTLVCSYTLEDIPYKLAIQDELDFTDQEEVADENVFLEPLSTIDLGPYIFGLISASIPMKVVKEGVRLPKDGKGYRIIKEDELSKERKNRKDPRFAALDDLKIDD